MSLFPMLPRLLTTFAQSVAVILIVPASASSDASAGEAETKLGRELFTHNWTARDPLSPQGDGLGPMHNAVSCVACHNLGGIGGAGSVDRNVELLSAAAPGESPSEPARDRIRQKAREIHPALFAGSNAASSVLLHHFSTESAYERWRLSVLGFNPPIDLEPTRAAVAMRSIRHQQSQWPPVVDLPRKNGVLFRLSRRNATALFGAGLIDSVSEETLVEVGKQQSQRFAGIEGRVPRTADGKLGRFGWRGQVGTLREFVLTACAVELGLQCDGHPQALNPLDPKSKLTGNDLTPQQCDALVAFVASLPAPEQRRPANQQEGNRSSNGEKLFETIGCAGCHVRDVGNLRGIFSDLLLHDLGPALEDPLAAFAARVKVETITTTGYGGGSVDIFADVPTRIRREWKTPPLWGVRDSAPYLHDGRAKTIAEAIAAHGGEAEPSAARFRKLDNTQRSNVLAFLNSLTAPQ